MSCDTEQGRFDFPASFEGGGIESREFTISIENSPVLSSAEIEFKLAGSDTVALSLNSGDELTLTSTASENWVITLEQVNAHGLAAGVYAYNFKTVDATGFPRTPLAGTLTIRNT